MGPCEKVDMEDTNQSYFSFAIGWLCISLATISHEKVFRWRQKSLINFFLVIYWLNIFNKVGLSLSKKMLFLLQLKPFKNDEKCSLSNLKRYFHSQGINIFVLTFRSCRRIILVRTRKFCIRRNNNNVDSLETGRIVTAHLLP